MSPYIHSSASGGRRGHLQTQPEPPAAEAYCYLTAAQQAQKNFERNAYRRRLVDIAASLALAFIAITTPAGAWADSGNGSTTDATVSVMIDAAVYCGLTGECASTQPDETGEPTLVVNSATDIVWVY